MYGTCLPSLFVLCHTLPQLGLAVGPTEILAAEDAVASAFETGAGDECVKADSPHCALSALQVRRSKQKRVEEACETCLRSCADGEDPGFRGDASYLECVERCGCNAANQPDQWHGALIADPYREGLFGPATSAEWGWWLLNITQMRSAIRTIPDSGTQLSDYESENFKRGGAVYSTVQTMSHDRNLYDPVRNVWTADKYLEDLRQRFGGVDQVLIWPSYPNIGVDSRSNLDMMADMPGGLARCFRELKAAQPGLLVQIAYMPWDILTNGSGQHDPERYAATMVQAQADGLNLDTMSSQGPFTGGLMPATLYSEAAARAGMPELIIEPELGLWAGAYLLNVTLQGWQYHLSSCGSMCPVKIPFTPRLSLQKWLARGSLPHICARWSKQHSQEILTAYFNAIGFTPWENIWGIWNGINDFDAELLRRTLTILRHFHPFVSDSSVGWLPFYPVQKVTLHGGGVFASKFAGSDKELWLLINAGLSDVSEADWQLPVPGGAGSQFYDLYAGRQLEPELSPYCPVRSCPPAGSPSTALLRVPLEAHGIGVVLRVLPGRALAAEDEALMAKMRRLTARPLASFSSAWAPIPQQHLVRAAGGGQHLVQPEDGGVLVKGREDFEFRVFGAEIEDAWFYANFFRNGTLNPAGNSPTGADVQYPWEAEPTKYHAAHTLSIGDLLVDKYPVTNEEFSHFLQAAAYAPSDAQNFLRHWGGLGCRGSSSCVMPGHLARQPVVFVGLEDARAYCAHKGKRLPHEWEWQYVAQAGDPSRLYPWGSDWRPDLMPAAQPNASYAAMGDVGQHPGGASLQGIEDLVGLIWHWTDEYSDAHTRAAVLRGGPAYQPGHSASFRYQPWYFPGHAKGGVWEKWGGAAADYGRKNFANLYRLTVHAKYLLMAPSLDRAGTIGFRCVADAGRSWMPAASFGWCLGFASTALRGARGMYVTTHAVEHFVEEHYGDQIARLGRELGAGERSPREAYEELQALLRAACADEVGHKEDAAQRAAALMGATGDGASGPGVTDRMHFAFVYWGSRVGAAVAKRL